MSDTENPETGMPTHCPMKVNAEGQGPISDHEHGTWGCWCADGLNCKQVLTDVDCEDWQTTDEWITPTDLHHATHDNDPADEEALIRWLTRLTRDGGEPRSKP